MKEYERCLASTLVVNVVNIVTSYAYVIEGANL